MPYGNYFPATYQPIYPQYSYNPQQMQNVQQMPQQQQAAPASQPMTSGIIWVQGEAGAKSYLVAPNTTVQLWDSEKQTIYIKSADASGMPSIKTLDYTIREMPQNSVSFASEGASGAFATKDEVNTLAEQIEALRSKIEAFSTRSGRRQQKEVIDDE